MNTLGDLLKRMAYVYNRDGSKDVQDEAEAIRQAEEKAVQVIQSK